MIISYLLLISSLNLAVVLCILFLTIGTACFVLLFLERYCKYFFNAKVCFGAVSLWMTLKAIVIPSLAVIANHPSIQVRKLNQVYIQYFCVWFS